MYCYLVEERPMQEHVRQPVTNFSTSTKTLATASAVTGGFREDQNID